MVKNEHFPTSLAEDFNHSLTSKSTTLKVVCTHMTDDFYILSCALSIDCEHWNARLVGLLYRWTNGKSVARHKDDC